MGGAFSWPTMPEVVEYRRQVRELILNIIADTPLELPITKKSPWVCSNSSFIILISFLCVHVFFVSPGSERVNLLQVLHLFLWFLTSLFY